VTEVAVNGERFRVHDGWNRLPVDLRDVDTLRIDMVDVTDPPEDVDGGAGGIRELRIPGVTATEALRVPTVAQDALRGVVRKGLSEVARTGLPGEHHFFISFATSAPGVRVSTRLLSQYPEEMTIVLQHQYWDLVVTEHAFEVGLSFSGIPERLFVPFPAVKAFADPSVGFQLAFAVVAPPAALAPGPAEDRPTLSVVSADGEDKPAAPIAALQPQSAPSEPETAEDEAPASGQVAEVVSLDAFRKK